MRELEMDIIEKTVELERELKHVGLWLSDMPLWVQAYDDNSSMVRNDFAQWLQFVFIPNHLHKNKTIAATERFFLVPQAIKHFGSDVKKGKLLQILIEIDSLI